MGSLAYAPEKWELTHGVKEDESRYTLVTERGERHIYCPRLQAGFIETILKGSEYPLPPPIVDVCKGLPIIDIGAHIGSANVYFDEVLQPSKVISCEPHPTCLGYLKKNINGRTEIIPKAVTDNDFGATLFVCGLENSDTEELINKPALNAGTICNIRQNHLEQIPVETIRAYDVLGMIPESQEIGLLKIDAEFSEANILLDAEWHLPRVRIVIIEYHSDTLRRQCDNLLRWFQPYFSVGHYRQGVIGYINARVAPEDKYF